MANSDVVARMWREAPEPTDEQWLEWWVNNGWSPNITWRASEGAVDDVGLMQGTARLCRHYQEWLELFEDIRSEASGFVDVGQDVVFQVHFSGRSRSTGMPLAVDYAIVASLDESGRIAAGREYATVAEAREAAELKDGTGFRL